MRYNITGRPELNKPFPELKRRKELWRKKNHNNCFEYIPQESKGSVSLSADIAYMYIPSQITCNCYSKVFNAFNVFKVSSLQGIWSMDLLDPFYCQLHHIAFDRLKSHTPLPCPGTQSINIPLKFHCVFFILNFTIANTVISKKSYFRLNIWWDVIYVQRE